MSITIGERGHFAGRLFRQGTFASFTPLRWEGAGNMPAQASRMLALPRGNTFSAVWDRLAPDEHIMTRPVGRAQRRPEYHPWLGTARNRQPQIRLARLWCGRYPTNRPGRARARAQQVEGQQASRGRGSRPRPFALLKC